MKKRIFLILVVLAMVFPLNLWGGEWRPGSAITKAGPSVSVKLLSAFQGLTEIQQKAILDKIDRRAYEKAVIPEGWIIDEMTYTSSDGQTRVAKNLVANLSETGILEARVYMAEGVPVQFVHVWTCNNMAVGKSLIKTKERAFPKTVEPKESPDDTFRYVLLDLSNSRHAFQKDYWDLYVGAGNYGSAKDGGDNNGQYAWGKFRYRPWWTESEDSLFGIGFFGFLVGGNGVADRDYDYSWKEKVIGFTIKAMLPHRDFDFDLGIGELENKGEWEGELLNKQVDKILLFSAHGNFYKNRDLDGTWFPKIEGNLEFRLPLSTDVEVGDDESDNKVIEACITQWLYDFHSGSFNFTPGFNLGGGYEWYSDHKAFIKIGPALEISSHGEVLAGISLVNYKFQGDGQWAPISFYVSIDGIWRAWKSREKKVSAESRKAIEECSDEKSRLIYSPADYLK